MGKNNKQRRAASKRKRRRDGRDHARSGPRAHDRGGTGQARGGTGERRGVGPPLTPDELIWAAVALRRAGDARYDAVLDSLASRAGEALPALERLLAQAVAALWDRGWTPATAVRVVCRQLSEAHGALAARLVLADGQARARDGEGLHPRWEAQLAALTERVAAAGVAALSARRLGAGIDVLELLVRLGEIPPTVPPPGAVAASPVAGAAAASGLDERVLARVRALLAKAESTEFDEEAEALTAKAQELIARHALDEALLSAASDIGEPSVRHIPVDDPYADAKASVLHQVASANRCRVVYSSDYGWVTAFGYDSDLDAVELLGASLLAQATGAMARLGSLRDASGRSRTRSFRRSFLLGFAHRVGERLREATAVEVAASDSARLLPVLSRRDERLDEVVARTFPTLVHRAGPISNALGFHAGQAAADLASLDVSAGPLDAARGPAQASPASVSAR